MMLPEILESLQRIREDNNFTPAAVTTFSETTTTHLSSSVRVKISEGSKDLHLFIKFLDPSQAGTPFYDDSLVYFRNEIVFYKEIASNFPATPDKKGRPTLTCLAKCYATACGRNEDEAPFIVLDDLVARGYTPLDVRQPLTAKDAQVVVRQLGQLHAHSIALRSRQPDVLKAAVGQLEETVFRRDKWRMFTGAMHDVHRLAKKAFPADSAYVSSLENFLLNVFDKLSCLVNGEDAEDDRWKVVTHGDLWLNNVLCKRDPGTGAICDPVFVDFQGCRYSSPIHDLMLVLLTGLERDELERQGRHLVQGYGKAVGATLAQLGLPHHPPPGTWDMNRQLGRHTAVPVALALAGLPVFLREEGEARHTATPPTTDSLHAFLRQLAEGKTLRCKNRMLELLVYAVDHRYI